MATETENKSVVYQISVRGPNGEEEKFNVSSEDSSAILRNRILMSPKFAVYTAFHFEVENAQGGEDLYLDDYVPFSQIPVIGNGATVLLVTDLYDTNSIRYQIKRSIALLSNKVPQISQLVSLNNDEVPDSLKDYASQMGQRAKEIEEKKEPQPLNLKIRVDERAKESDAAFKEFSSKLGQGKDMDLEAFMGLFDVLNEEQPVAIKSLSLSSYNPPSPSRRAMGDLIYLRVGLASSLSCRCTLPRTTSCTSLEAFPASLQTRPLTQSSIQRDTAITTRCIPLSPPSCAPCPPGLNSGICDHAKTPTAATWLRSFAHCLFSPRWRTAARAGSRARKRTRPICSTTQI